MNLYSSCVKLTQFCRVVRNKKKIISGFVLDFLTTWGNILLIYYYMLVAVYTLFLGYCKIPVLAISAANIYFPVIFISYGPFIYIDYLVNR